MLADMLLNIILSFLTNIVNFIHFPDLPDVDALNFEGLSTGLADIISILNYFLPVDALTNIILFNISLMPVMIAKSTLYAFKHENPL